MVDRDIPAEQALVAVSVYLAFEALWARDLELWIAELRRAVSRCGACAQSLFAIRAAAWALCDKEPERRGRGIAEMRIAVRDYYALQAVSRIEAMGEDMTVVE